ncbi:SDR family oxidoreductase [Mycobacterium sp. 050128]|uniref:SDR family oxidoreductase n=1 Tax=Mycobacterium sp. 050128 TaxID=3096112 RepID=UPI003FA5300F
MKFSGKNVLVTGATSGVGREAAKLFAQHGAAVIVTGRDETRGKEVVKEVEELEIANAIAYLCSEESSFITGAVVPVDGGRVSVL